MDLITLKQEKGLCFSVKVRGHKFLVDMPKDSKGENQGPSPADLLASALGACMGMHMALYCQTAGLSCEGMEMNLVYNLIQEKDRKRISAVTIDVNLPQNLGDAGSGPPAGGAELHCPQHPGERARDRYRHHREVMVS